MRTTTALRARTVTHAHYYRPSRARGRGRAFANEECVLVLK
jgi:hypothetical protein